MNVELLRATVKYIEDEPRRFNMVTWYIDVEPGNEDSLEYLNKHLSWNGIPDGTTVEMEDMPPCGAVGCLAGNVAILAKLTTGVPDNFNPQIVHHYPPRGGWFGAAQAALEITKEQAERLFYPSAEFVEDMPTERAHWPQQFTDAYRAATTPAQRAKVLHDRVEHFIATDGEDEE